MPQTQPYPTHRVKPVGQFTWQISVPLIRRSLHTCQSSCASAADVCRFTLAAGSVGSSVVLC